MNITFITGLDFMTYKQYTEQPMPMVERMVNTKSYKNNELLRALDNIGLTLHMGPYQNGREDIYVSSDEDE